MKTTIKAFIALAAAFVITTQISQHVFLGNSPTLRPNLGSYIALRLKTIWGSGSSYFASIFQKNETATQKKTETAKIPNFQADFQAELQKKQEVLKNTVFKKLSQGVYAKDEGDTHSLVEIRLGEIEFIEHTFTVNGKTIKIRIPKDQQLPPQQILEKMYGN